MSGSGELIAHVIDRCGSALSGTGIDVRPAAACLKIPEHLAGLSALSAITGEHPHGLEMHNCFAPASYFLGNCSIGDSVLYRSDIRGDELKCAGAKCPVNETIVIRDSILFKTLVHSNSHDLGSPGEFAIRDSIAMHYSNIHGAPIKGCLLKPFATIDLTSAVNCAIGTYSYVQTGKMNGRLVEDGHILISSGDFEFEYTFDPAVLPKYIRFGSGAGPSGIIFDEIERLESEFGPVFSKAPLMPASIPASSYCNPYSLVKGDSRIGENAFVAQRACIENSSLGDGANAQENCCIVDSVLEGFNVSAHGSKMINSRLCGNVFVGFNSFLRGTGANPLKVGSGSIVAPHTIIDVREGLEIPPDSLVWGYIGAQGDLAAHSIPIDTLAATTGELKSGRMVFRGSGAAFVKAFRHRIEHILEGNGALIGQGRHPGHAQKYGNVTFKSLGPRQ